MSILKKNTCINDLSFLFSDISLYFFIFVNELRNA